MTDFFRYDFGYTWTWGYGHLIAAAAALALGAAAWRLRWRAAAAGLGIVAVWAAFGAGVVHGPMGLSRPLPLPTERFLPGGTGRVLDGGAGSGRATLMVLLARPRATVVALDIFAEGYGIGGNTPERLLANVRVAGAGGRTEVQQGDLRAMPFPEGSFDAAVSAYAIDHLNREGVARSLAEMRRVLRPDGQLLLMVINNDAWIRAAFPFLAAHGYFGPTTAPERWTTALEQAGLRVAEQGTRPGTLFLLAEKPPPAVSARTGRVPPAPLP